MISADGKAASPYSAAAARSDAHRHLKAELTHLIELLALHLERQRARGRTPAADAVRGMVIEEGEAEGLLAQLAARWGRGPAEPARHKGPESYSQSGAARRAEYSRGQRTFLPLLHAGRRFDLEPPEYDALLLALSVELEPRFGRLVAYLNDHVGHTRPTVGLAFSLQAEESAVGPLVPAGIEQRPLFRDGLVELEGEGPLPGRAMRLGPEMRLRLTADALVEPQEREAVLHRNTPGLLKRLVLTEGTREKLSNWAILLRQAGNTARPLILAGPAGSGRTSAARAATSERGLDLVEVEVSREDPEANLKRARREVRWYGAAALLKVPDSDIEAAYWHALWAGVEELNGPVLLEVSREQAEAAAAAKGGSPSAVLLGEPGLDMRARLWQAVSPAGGKLQKQDFSYLASRFRFTPGRMVQALRRAQAQASLLPADERRLTLANLASACRAVGAAEIGSLAQKLPLPFCFADLVVPGDVQQELDLAVTWVHHQHQVLSDWGFGRRVPYGHGLTVLFSGPPGTGKTMAAQVLARELELDLFRVDLSQVMSKYIGETERNLARLFDEAHASGAILFFDEADALFGKRTEVKDAHDRYANVEIGYLLQRMEEHDGVTILATNRRADLDEAFMRRFHCIVTFPMPSEQDRLRIWEGMFPEEVQREPDLDLQPFAKRFEISGGETRNAVLAAAYLATADSKPIGLRHLKRALRRELRKAGRFVDEKELEALK